MPFDSSPADSAPTRRSSRTAAGAEESRSVVDAQPLTRAELRRQAKAPREVVSAPSEAVATSVAPALPDDSVVVAHEAAPVAAPLTRRRARTLAKPGVPVFETVPDASVDEITAAAQLVDDTVDVDDAPVVDVLPEIAVVPVADAAVEADALPEVVVEAADAQAEPEPDAESEASIDAFAAAAKAFAFTGETPVQASSDEVEEASAETDDDLDTGPAPAGHHVGRRQQRRIAVRRVATASFSVGVMGIVGLLAVGMTTPSQAVAAASGANPHSIVAGDVEGGGDTIQAYVVSDSVQNNSIERVGNYTMTSLGAVARESGITKVSDFFTNDPNAPIQWPFAVGVPITYGFGMRDGGMHHGVDFTPGEGADVHAVADGVVRVATESGGQYGVTVVIDHQIDGQLVSTRYAHMLYGSLKVRVGDTIKAGTTVGNTGDTGYSFGPHMHFEVMLNGTTRIDPLPWLRTHAGG